MLSAALADGMKDGVFDASHQKNGNLGAMLRDWTLSGKCVQRAVTRISLVFWSMQRMTCFLKFLMQAWSRLHGTPCSWDLGVL